MYIAVSCSIWTNLLNLRCPRIEGLRVLGAAKGETSAALRDDGGLADNGKGIGGIGEQAAAVASHNGPSDIWRQVSFVA